MNAVTKRTEPRLRFRINMLLAERDMTLKELYDRVKALGSPISSSHFYRQMKPYYSPVRLDLLTLVMRALKATPAELFELVEVEVDEDETPRHAVVGTEPKATLVDETDATEKAKAAQASARMKRHMAMLGTRISLVTPAKPK